MVDKSPLMKDIENGEEELSPSKNLMQKVMNSKQIDHIELFLQLSVFTNVIIVSTMTAVALASHSLALLSSLAENIVDLCVQAALWYAASQFGKKRDFAKFPAGTSRFEPITVIAAAIVMGLVAIKIIEESVVRLVRGFMHEPEVPSLSLLAALISFAAISTKVALVFYARFILRTQTYSAAVLAVMQDNRNDIISNFFALIAYMIAASCPSLWFLDAAGAILIFLFILVDWSKTAKEHIMQLVGLTASKEFIDEITDLCGRHHRQMQLDILRAYHFGTKYLVEIEILLPETMTVREAHDIAIQLQFKVEQHEEVERAFVHVDYKPREYDEHRVSKDNGARFMLNHSPCVSDNEEE